MEFSCQSSNIDPTGLEGTDVLTYMWHIFEGTTSQRRELEPDPEPEPWQETDRLIAVAKVLEQKARGLLQWPHLVQPTTQPVEKPIPSK